MAASATTLALPLDPGAVLGGFLAFLRASAWLVGTPPFSHRSIPIPAKVGLAAGLALGMVVNILMSAAQSAGTAIGLFGGFALPTALDPMSQEETNIVGQVYGLLAITLLFVLDGHIFLVRGFMASFGAVGASLHSMGGVGDTIVHDLASFFVSALQIAAPLLAVLFMAQVVLGLLAKAAPQLNVFVLGLPFQVLLTLALIGIGIRLLPGVIVRLVEMSVSDMGRLAHAL